MDQSFPNRYRDGERGIMMGAIFIGLSEIKKWYWWIEPSLTLFWMGWGKNSPPPPAQNIFLNTEKFWQAEGLLTLFC